MTVGDTNRLRIVSIHADEMLRLPVRHRRLEPSRAGRRSRATAPISVALRTSGPAVIEMGPGQTADFPYVPQRAGELMLEVWITPAGTRVVQPIIVDERKPKSGG